MPSRNSVSGDVPKPRWWRTDAHTAPGVMPAGPKVTANTTDATSTAPSTPAAICGLSTARRRRPRVEIASPLPIKPQLCQLIAQLRDRRDGANARLARGEGDHQVPLIHHGIQFGRRRVALEHADLLLHAVPRRVDEHDHVGVRVDDG